MPSNLRIVSAAKEGGDVVTIDPQRILESAEEYNGDRSVVFIDTEGTTNHAMMAGLYPADIVLVPVFYALDEVTAAVQTTDHYVPLIAQERERPLPCLFIETKYSIIDDKAGDLSELREIIMQNGTPMSKARFWSRVVYRDLQSGQTLFSRTKVDAKAVAESEAVFDEVLETFVKAIGVAA